MDICTIIDALDRLFANRESWTIRLEVGGYYNHDSRRRIGALPQALESFVAEHGGKIIIRRTSQMYSCTGKASVFDLERRTADDFTYRPLPEKARDLPPEIPGGWDVC